MLIDPFVVIAQIINFLILVALLKRFLYEPITQAMVARQQRIERQLTMAALKEKEAEKEKEIYQQKQRELEAQKQVWLEQAKQEIAQEKEKLLKQVEAEIHSIKSQWYDSFEQEKQKFIQEIRNQLSKQIFLIAQKALADLANTNLETQIIDKFIERLNELDELTIRKTRDVTVSSSEDIVIIRSSFVIPPIKKEEFINAIQTKISTKVNIKFEIAEDLLCGIELRYLGYKISWNLAHYLAELEHTLNKLLLTVNSQK